LHSFSLSRHGARPALLSFPTRRSSDLVLACHLGERFSAFAPVAGAYYPQSTAGCDYSTPTPMLAIHGTADATMHYDGGHRQGEEDRKSTRLNSSHVSISYAVFCLKKKK